MLSRVASWHHGSSVSVILTPIRRRRSPSASSVIFGNSRAGSAGIGRGTLIIAQGSAIDLARWRLRQLGNERDLARVLVSAEARPREVLQLAREGLVAAARADDERLHDLTAERIGDADH